MNCYLQIIPTITVFYARKIKFTGRAGGYSDYA